MKAPSPRIPLRMHYTPTPTTDELRECAEARRQFAFEVKDLISAVLLRQWQLNVKRLFVVQRSCDLEAVGQREASNLGQP